VLRTAVPSDLGQITDLLTARGDAADALDHRLVMGDPDAGWESCAVVADGHRIVSTATLLDETLILGQVEIPAGQVELVATDREYEGRGLMRALMTWAHERSASRGHLVQVMIGIPYFYRQFGYQYAIDMAQSRAVRTLPSSADNANETDDDRKDLVRTAGTADIPAMAALQDAAQGAYDLRMPHSPACWRWLTGRDGSTQLLVERDGAPVATGRITPPDDEEVVLGEIAATDAAAARALIRHAADQVGTDVFVVVGRPGYPGGDAIETFLEPPPRHTAQYYVRVPDIPALLEHLRPVLSARLAASTLTEHSGEAVISFFRHHVRIPITNGAVGKPEPGGPMQAPGVAGGAGVAPDLVGPLLFGQRGIAGLTEHHPDVYTGPSEELMRTLFPPVSADLLTFYLP
jgi:GNAT superfamily N-acetyltransferase